MMMLGPLWLDSEPYLDGYGGTWHRRWSFGLRLRAFALSLAFSLGRVREKGR